MKDFYIDDQGQLVLCYSPENDSLVSILMKLNGEAGAFDTVTLNNTIKLTKSILLDELPKNIYEEWKEDEAHFVIGVATDDGKYISLSEDVFSITSGFFFDVSIPFANNLFSKNNVSAVKALSSAAKRDIFIDSETNFRGEENHISLAQYKEFIARLPTRYEVDIYKRKAAEISAAQFLNVDGGFTERYERYTRKKYSSSPYSGNLPLDLSSAKIQEYKQSLAYLEALLHNQDEPEGEWQRAIADLLPLLYPKYLYVFGQFEFEALGDIKKPDFIAIDTDGNVDVIEIKKADIGKVLRLYRDNYVPVSEISCACVQIEQYIFHMMSNKSLIEKKIQEKYKDEIGPLKINIINPQGVLIAGKSEGLDERAKRDFEVAKRMHKHIYDIVTYDILIERLKNAIAAYEYQSIHRTRVCSNRVK